MANIWLRFSLMLSHKKIFVSIFYPIYQKSAKPVKKVARANPETVAHVNSFSYLCKCI